MNQTLEFIPVLLFGLSYVFTDIFTATTVLLVSMLICTGILYLRTRKLTSMQIGVLGLTVVFCLLTLYLHNEQFLQWKVTIINALLGAVFIIGHFFKKTPLEYMIGDKLKLPSFAWIKLNLAWAGLFFFIAVVNTILILVLKDLSLWVLFKSIGVLVITILFTIGMGLYISKHMIPDDKEDSSSALQ